MSLTLYGVKSKVKITGKSWFFGRFKTLVDEVYNVLVVTDKFNSAAEYARNHAPHFFTRLARPSNATIDTLEVTKLNQDIILHPSIMYSSGSGTLYGVLVEGSIYDKWDGPTKPVAGFSQFFSVLAKTHDEATAWAQFRMQGELQTAANRVSDTEAFRKFKRQMDTTITSSVVLAENVSFDSTVEVKRG